MGMEVAVERATGRIKVERVTCAHDCGLIVNPDGVRSQVEGCIIAAWAARVQRVAYMDDGLVWC
jgi:CO/xanthine dehydrogenase Mo-binding subunit